MKKYFPIIAFLTVFTGFVVGQVAFNLQDLVAGPAKEEKKVTAHYESVFKSLSFTTFEKKKVKLSKVKAPIVILNFWASWCKPCLVEFPSIVDMKKRFADSKVMVFAINSDDEKQIENIKKVVKKYGLNFPVVADKEGVILEKFMVSAIPVSIIFHKGKLVDVTRGAKDFNSEEIFEKFNSLLKN